MKKPISYLSMMVSTMPFAFYELDGPFGVLAFDPQREYCEQVKIDEQANQLTCPIERLKLNNLTAWIRTIQHNNHSYIFMYDRVNGYSIGYYPPMHIMLNQQVMNFFLGNNSFKKGQKGGWTDDYSKFEFYFFKERSNLVIEGSQEILEGCDKSMNFNRDYRRGNTNKTPGVWTLLNQEFTTSSRVRVINKEDSLKISIDDKSIPFETVLKRRFNSSKAQDNLIDVISKRKVEGNNEKDLMLNTYEINNTAKSLSDGIFLEPKQAKLLDKSKILAVYGVFKNDKEQDSLIWGLAEVADDSQPTGKRKFHWITDLKCDLLELLK